MGKGRILENHGEGRYTIEIVEDRARAESARAIAVSRAQDLDQRISDLDAEVVTLQSAVDQAATEQDQAIDLHRQQLEDDGESDVDLAAYAALVLDAAEARDRVRSEIRQLNVERLGLQARIQRIDALPPLRQVEAWCADLTEDLDGDVATAEVPGEVGRVLIKPGFHDDAAWSSTSDGAIQPVLSGTPAGVFYNLAMMPGWQKWRPTFRLGTITAIDSDLCDVELDAAASSQQGLGVNSQNSYSDVPIYYMDCNGAAFEVGDRALVAFSGNTGQPMVVGFEESPRECCLYTRIDFREISSSTYIENSFRAKAFSIVFNRRICLSSIELTNVGQLAGPDVRGVLILYRCSAFNTPSEVLFWGEVSPEYAIVTAWQNGYETARVESGEPLMVVYIPVKNEAGDGLPIRRVQLLNSFDDVAEVDSFHPNYFETYAVEEFEWVGEQIPLDPAYYIGKQFSVRASYPWQGHPQVYFNPIIG